MATILKPPIPLLFSAVKPSLFLAGSIEMGRAEHWQQRVEQTFSKSDIVILNPRRDDWDSSWIQSIENPQFRGQVEWELEAQERASLIIMYFAPDTQSPITLLELGIFARSGKLLVCCPKGFWRKGNIEVTCARYGIPLTDSFEELLNQAKQRLGSEEML